MSVEYQDDIGEDWDMAAAMGDTDSDESPAKREDRFSNLNKALVQAGSVLGDVQDPLPMAFRFTWHRMPIFAGYPSRIVMWCWTWKPTLAPFPILWKTKNAAPI